MFVLDTSGSITEDKWATVLEFLEAIVDRIKTTTNDVNIGVITFGNRARMQFTLNEYDNKQDIINNIRELRYTDGNTNTSGGIWMMREEGFSEDNGDRPGIKNLGVVFTDGRSTYDQENTIPYADDAKADGITMFAIGVGPDIDEREIRGIASNDDYVWFPEEFGDLGSIEDALVSEMCPEEAGMYRNITCSA